MHRSVSHDQVDQTKQQHPTSGTAGGGSAGSRHSPAPATSGGGSQGAQTVPQSVANGEPIPESEKQALIALYMSLSRKRPKPSEEQASRRLEITYWIVDWALALDRLDAAEEKQATLSSRLQKASEESTTSLKHLKFLQNNLYAQQEEAAAVKKQLETVEDKAASTATELTVLQAQVSVLSKELENSRQNAQKQVEAIRSLETKLEEKQEPTILFVARDSVVTSSSGESQGSGCTLGSPLGILRAPPASSSSGGEGNTKSPNSSSTSPDSGSSTATPTSVAGGQESSSSQLMPILSGEVAGDTGSRSCGNASIASSGSHIGHPPARCRNCVALTAIMKEEQRKIKEQMELLAAQVQKAEANAERRISTEVEAMLQELQAHYRAGLYR